MKKKYQKRSVYDRDKYYRSRKNMTESQRLFSQGFGDGAYDLGFNFYLGEKKSYMYGYKRGQKARETAFKIKF